MTDPDKEGQGESTWDRLRRRKLVQWGIAYAAGGWGFLQGLQYVSDAFGWPAQIRQVAVLTLLIGLPIVLVVAWYHGDRGEQRVTATELTIVTLLFVLGGGIFWRYERASETTPTAITAPEPAATAITDMRPSIAVLPFENRSDQSKDAYFVDGIQNDILTQLTKIGAMKVIARTSVEQFRGTRLTTREIGQKLGVVAVLEGGVQRAGDRVRISVQLIDVATDAQLWAERYDRQLSAADIFAIQSEVAAAIASALKASLTPSEQARVDAVPTRSLEAWEAYQLGRQRVQRRTRDTLAQAAEFFRRAVERDPGFALAHAAQAETVLLQMEYAGQPYGTGVAAAEAAVARALEIDPDLAEALTIAAALATMNGDTDRAESLFLRAMTLNPNSPTAPNWYSGLLMGLGRNEQSLLFAKQAQKLDPLAAPINLDVGRAFERVGRFDDALQTYRRVIEIDPAMPAVYAQIAFLQGYALDRMSLAVPWYEKARRLDPENPALLPGLAILHGDLGGSHELIARRLLEDAARQGIVWAESLLAFRHLAAGERGKARGRAMKAHRAGAQDVFALRALRDIDLSEGDVVAARARYAAAFPALLGREPRPFLGDYFVVATDLVPVLQELGESEQAAELLEQAERFMSGLTRLGVGGFGITDVQIHALRGDRAKALAALREAEKAGWRGPLWRYQRDVDPALASIRNEPEFKAVFADIERDMARQRAELAARPKNAPLDLQEAVK